MEDRSWLFSRGKGFSSRWSESVTSRYRSLTDEIRNICAEEIWGEHARTACYDLKRHASALCTKNTVHSDCDGVAETLGILSAQKETG